MWVTGAPVFLQKLMIAKLLRQFIISILFKNPNFEGTFYYAKDWSDVLYLKKLELLKPQISFSSDRVDIITNKQSQNLQWPLLYWEFIKHIYILEYPKFKTFAILATEFKGQKGMFLNYESTSKFESDACLV